MSEFLTLVLALSCFVGGWLAAKSSGVHDEDSYQAGFEDGLRNGYVNGHIDGSDAVLAIKEAERKWKESQQ